MDNLRSRNDTIARSVLRRSHLLLAVVVGCVGLMGAGRVEAFQLPDLSAWESLISWRPPADVQRLLRNRTGLVDWPPHRIEDAHGPINLDYYGVRITRMPEQNGLTMTREELVTEVRLNLNAFIDTGVSQFSPYDAAEGARWRSSDPMGAVIHIDLKTSGGINPDDGSVVVSGFGPESWVFSTIWTAADLAHPVSGNRQFGMFQDEDGVDWFYVMGADRPTGLTDLAIKDTIFFYADKLWTSLAQEVVASINQNQGSASFDVRISDRYDWAAVKALYWNPTTPWL